MNEVFSKFFSIGHVKLGPQITSVNCDGDWLGSVFIFSTKKDIFLKNGQTIVGIREYNNSVTEEFYTALTFLSMSKEEFDYLINKYFLQEWDCSDELKKPDVSNLKKRAYIGYL